MLNKIIPVLSLLAANSKAESYKMFDACLENSAQYVGKSAGSIFTNKDQLSEEVTTDMHLQSLTACTNDYGNVVGLQFIMSSNDYRSPRDFTADEVLDPIGVMRGKCDDIPLTGPLDRIRASDSNGDGLKGLRFYRGGRAKTFGTIDDEDDSSYREWFFADDSPLVGYFGSQSENGIEHLSFISYDSRCQTRLEA